jgi:hydroxymethylbilane synthase
MHGLKLRRLRGVQLKDEFLIGARGSPLSMAQTGMVSKALEGLHPGLKVRIVPIKTSGDDPGRRPTGPLGVKGLFVKEIEEALLAGSVDLAVHSAKDLPGSLPDGLSLGAVPERFPPFDALVSDQSDSIKGLPQNSRIGTSSLRRRAQLKALRPDLKIILIRGNLETRANKVKSKECDAVVLAEAGILRLKGKALPFFEIPPSDMLPAPGQGILALEARQGDEMTMGLLEPLNHPPSETALSAERAFMKRLGTGCQTPAAAWARFEDSMFKMEALVSELDGSTILRAEGVLEPATASPQEAALLGARLAQELLDKGGAQIIERAESENLLEWEA